MKTADAMSTRLARCYTGSLFDALRERGERCVALPSDIRLLDPRKPIAGRAFTVEGSRKADVSEHETLLSWTSFLSAAPAGHVVVCQPNDSSLAHMGELSAETLLFRDVAGYVVDGGARDSAIIRQLGFRVACRYTTPADIVASWSVDAIAEPINVGGVEIRTGDFIVVDCDGGIVVPANDVTDVVSRAEELMSTETDLRAALRAGADPREAYLRFGVF